MKWISFAAALLAVGLSAATLQAAPSLVDRLTDDVVVVRDDAGNWADGSMSTTHQRGPAYAAKKILDLAAVPEAFWQKVTTVRLAAFFCVHDYSWHDLPKPNGLDETLLLEVNGETIAVPTKAGLPVFPPRKGIASSIRWHDFAVPKTMLRRGLNEIVIRLAEPAAGKKPDDYIYLGIDNSVPGGKSQVRLAAKGPWLSDRVNSIGAKGEYMVRLYLLGGSRKTEALWQPGMERPTDPAALLQFTGTLGTARRVEWDVARIDRLDPVTVVLETADAKPFDFHWLNAEGLPLAKASKGRGPRQESKLRPDLFMPAGVEIPAGVALKSVRLIASRDYHPQMPRIDMVPQMSRPRGRPVDRPAACHLAADRITLTNRSLRATFAVTAGHLRLTSLYNELAVAEMVRPACDSPLWLVEVEGKRYAGSRDFVCRQVERDEGRQGFRAMLACKATGLEARLRVWIDDRLHLDLELVNRAAKPVDFKTAFPVLAGLAVSDDPTADYYFYPLGGGIIADAPAVIRQGYGDHQALYQLMDLFSPARGAGLAVSCADDRGRYKVLALRKSIPGQSEIGQDKPQSPTSDEFKWTNPLDAVRGTSLAFEYLRRTRAPGQSFSPAEAVLAVHAGDWRGPMRAYADWCHRVWKFRPASRLADVWTMIAVGWGRDVLYRDGKYRTDFLRPGGDCWELMSWWEWSALGPWSTPMERIRDVLDAPTYERWKGYFVTDPVTGKTMWNNQPGDYDGYNRRFGGLKTFRAAVEEYKKSGALVTLYTDPIRCDDASKIGQAHGRDWGVVQPDGKHVKSYEVWNMCHDVAEYRQWVAQNMKRVMRETGADGIRLDEYGHRGWACFNKQHRHTFAEWGNTEWQRAIAETSKLVRQAMDEVAPGSVLTTEHPGYDYLMQYLEGCITYDLTVVASPLRPLECNLQRFLFPECKPYELDHRGADRKLHKRFWNGVASFGAFYPEPMYRVLHENQDAWNSRQCEPLVPTLIPHVYANRFGSGDKTLYTLYNATGHTVGEPMLWLDLAAGWHVVELLSATETPCQSIGKARAVRLTLARDDVACLAVLPQRLTVTRAGTLVEVNLRDPRPGLTLRVCDAAGKTLVERAPAARGATAFNLKEIQGAAPACVKLLAGPKLVDLASLKK
jgi:hypothetical protein